MMHTELYCGSLEQLDRVKAIRAIHEAWLQLKALGECVDCYDNKPAMQALSACLHEAGHPGF